MSILDSLEAGLAAAESALTALGPRPPGDPAGLMTVAKKVRAAADDAATAARLEAGIPRSLVFDGPASERFERHAEQVSQSLFSGQRMLDGAAGAIEREARGIHAAQQAHDRARGRLGAQIGDLAAQLVRRAR